jgi:hypothetical protein
MKDIYVVRLPSEYGGTGDHYRERCGLRSKGGGDWRGILTCTTMDLWGRRGIIEKNTGALWDVPAVNAHRYTRNC